MNTYVIPCKQPGTGSIHDIAGQFYDREVKVPATAEYIIILAASYGGRGYSTHRSAAAALRKYKALRMDGISFRVFRADGQEVSLVDTWPRGDFKPLPGPPALEPRTLRTMTRYFAIIAPDRSGPAWGIGLNETGARRHAAASGFPADEGICIEITRASFRKIKAGNPDAVTPA